VWESLTKAAEISGSVPQGDGAKFVESLKDDSGIGKNFAESLKEDANAGKDFADSLKEEMPREALDTSSLKIGRECIVPRTGGEWKGESGDSVWYPDRDKKPENPKTNPDKQTWGEILDEFGIEGIPFKDGEPDFSEVSKGTVEIDDFSEDRDDNFDAADEALAKQRGCTKEEVRHWRKDHGYTWHECRDMKTMQKVPTKVHGNIPHSGGISEKKKENGNG
jgi:hypothetical protein